MCLVLSVLPLWHADCHSIVLVHGLNSHLQDMWMAKNGIFWPSQLLPQMLKHNKVHKSVQAQILVYGYNTDMYTFGCKSTMANYILQHVQTLVMTLDLEHFNKDVLKQLIVFVVHLLGGILVKKALNYLHNISNVNSENLWLVFVLTYGIIFLGTPHNGTDPAKWGKMVQSMCTAMLPKKILDSKLQLVAALCTQSKTLQNINVAFVHIMDKFCLAFFHKALKTNFSVLKDFVVNQSSAALIMPGPAYASIKATHLGMCKFDSKNTPGYTSVSSFIKRCAQDTPTTVAM